MPSLSVEMTESLQHNSDSLRNVTPSNHLDLTALENGRENRTTVMIKNIPNKITAKELLEVISLVTPQAIDFFFLRIDFKTSRFTFVGCPRT
jgi:hypothetical protein